jgi:hypothetical protein
LYWCCCFCCWCCCCGVSPAVTMWSTLSPAMCRASFTPCSSCCHLHHAHVKPHLCAAAIVAAVITWSTLSPATCRASLTPCSSYCHLHHAHVTPHLGAAAAVPCSDYVEHFESSHVQGFLDTLAENDIPWSLTPLYRPDVAELVSFQCNWLVSRLVVSSCGTAVAQLTHWCC